MSYNKYNKPFLKGDKIRFNISHSGNLAICALSGNTDVGIDIEFMKDIEIDDFKMQMTDREWKQIYHAELKKVAFYNYWTKKEAVIKADGMGLSIPLKSFEVIDNHANINNQDFFIKEIELANNYKCHLAFREKIDLIILEPEQVSF